MLSEGKEDPLDIPRREGFAELRQEWIPRLLKLQEENLLLRTNDVNSDDLESNEDTSFKQVLEKYHEELHDETPIFKDSRVILRYESSMRSTYVGQYWQSLVEFVSSKKKPIPTHFMTEIIRTLASSLSMPSLPKVSSTSSGPFSWAYLDIPSLFNNRQESQELPLVLYTAPQFTKENADELRQLIIKEVAPTTRLALMVFFLESRYIKEALEVLKNVIHRVHALDIVPMMYENFREIIDAREPLKVLRRLILSNVDLTYKSPFVINGPTADTMFFGREHELRMITEYIVKGSYVLIGGRRVGKTSILHYLRDVRLSKDFRVLFYDCEEASSHAELVEGILLDKSWFPQPPATRPRSFAHIVRSLPEDKPLVILLDEADKLIEPDRVKKYKFFNSLRALSNTGRCYFVLSGERFLREELVNPVSPLYNFGNELVIGRLDHDTVEVLITESMQRLEIELVDKAAMVERIWNFTSGHPNVVQRFCKRLVLRLNYRNVFRLTMEDVEAVIRDPEFLRVDFLTVYWERADLLEQLCSLVMAGDGRVRTLQAVHEALTKLHLSPTLNEVNDALERLVDLRNILQHTASGYEFAVTAFPEVIAKTNRLDDLIATRCETYRETNMKKKNRKRS